MRFSCHSINILVSGNAGDEKNIHPGDRKKKEYQFNFSKKVYTLQITLTALFCIEKQRALSLIV